MCQVLELDDSFAETDRHQTVGLVDTDGHDSVLLDNGHVILLAYEPNPETGLVDSVIQEQDADGNVVFEWNSDTDGGLVEETVTPDIPDYSHLNSVVVMADGDLLASFRHTSSVLKIARTAHDGFQVGDVVWRLGGRNSDFDFVDDTSPAGPCAQHTASELENGNILIYSNGSGFISDPMCVDPADPNGDPVARIKTRAIEYDLDEDAGTARLAWSYESDRAAFFAGSAVRLDSGNTLLGWAAVRGALASEVDADGRVVWDLQDATPQPDPFFATYRAAPFPVAEELDVQSPTLEVRRPAVDATYEFGQRVRIDQTCSDHGGSTLRVCGGTRAGGRGGSGTLLDTSTPGRRTYLATAVDGAGNSSAVRVPYTVEDGYRPDLALKVPGGKLGPRVVRRVPDIRGWVRTIVKVRNAGTGRDSFKLRAKPRRKGFVTKFYAGGRNVTQRVKKGTYRTAAVAPGRAAKVVIKTKRLRRVQGGDRWRQVLRVTSRSDPSRRDRASHVVKAVG